MGNQSHHRRLINRSHKHSGCKTPKLILTQTPPSIVSALDVWLVLRSNWLVSAEVWKLQQNSNNDTISMATNNACLAVGGYTLQLAASLSVAVNHLRQYKKLLLHRQYSIAVIRRSQLYIFLL